MLFLSFIEEALNKTTIHYIDKIENCYVREENGMHYVDIAGSNIQKVLNLMDELFFKDELKSNSIWDIYHQFGVEAAR